MEENYWKNKKKPVYLEDPVKSPKEKLMGNIQQAL
jgi:hypothetical protein